MTGGKQLKNQKVSEMSILKLADLIRIRSEEIKEKENISDLKAFNKAYEEIVKKYRSEDLCL